jgi:predicted RNase H-like HicB family nuclease
VDRIARQAAEQADLRSEASPGVRDRDRKAENNYSAYVPDLPGCVATGASLEEVEVEIREAIEFHLEGMREDGVAIPVPQSKVDYVEVSA